MVFLSSGLKAVRGGHRCNIPELTITLNTGTLRVPLHSSRNTIISGPYDSEFKVMGGSRYQIDQTPNRCLSFVTRPADTLEFPAARSQREKPNP